MKKLIYIVLCLITLLLCFSMTAFAAENIQYYGDVNNDGKVTSSDGRKTLRVAAMLEDFTDIEFKLADMNQDGKITSSDARRILRVSAMLDPAIQYKSEAEKYLSDLCEFEYFQEYAEKHNMENVTVMKNKLNNILIIDRRTKTSVMTATVELRNEIDCEELFVIIKEDEKDREYPLRITDYEKIPDNMLITLTIYDYSANAYKDYNVMLTPEYNISPNAITIGRWIYNTDKDNVDDEPKPPIDTEIITKLVKFEKCQPTDIMVDKETATYYVNETRNIVVIDNRTDRHKYETPFEVVCNIGKAEDNSLEDECYIITISAVCDNEPYSYVENFDGAGILLIQIEDYDIDAMGLKGYSINELVKI